MALWVLIHKHCDGSIMVSWYPSCCVCSVQVNGDHGRSACASVDRALQAKEVESDSSESSSDKSAPVSRSAMQGASRAARRYQAGDASAALVGESSDSPDSDSESDSSESSSDSATLSGSPMQSASAAAGAAAASVGYDSDSDMIMIHRSC